MSNVTLTMIDGTQIVVPDSLHQITPYVLREQRDWFEDEIKFLRRLLQPGQKAIDIGASYGVYTLSMAKTVGPTGRVWAFEPGSFPASLLAQGIAANDFAQVILERSALSDAKGTSQLSMGMHSECNSLIPQAAAGSGESVRVTTLDDCMKAFGWRNIDFMKVDAEGEEARILKGGNRFFAELSPLVQYEVRAGTELHMDLVEAFKTLGYDSYRLVPGLDLLVPFSTDVPLDQWMLNLFACKPDRAARLAAQGFLLDSALPLDRVNGTLGGPDGSDPYGWRSTLAKLPYGEQFANRWEERVALGGSGEVEEALILRARSRDSSLSPVERFSALKASLIRFTDLCEREPSNLRLASLARVAREYGARAVAAKALQRLSNALAANWQGDPGEPFLAPAERFDWIPPGENPSKWVVSAVLEEQERNTNFSSIYTGTSGRANLETIRALGFGGAEMQRRLDLINQRYG